jgi:cytosine/adenosine deaminase-related metal-dependent hydrolase
MSSSLIRGRYVVCKVTGSAAARVLTDAAVFQRDGVIADVGPYRELRAKHAADEVLGSPDHVVMPGFVNSHHHVGLTPFQLGSPDYPLELWIASRASARDVDPYLDTLYSAFEMLESGITCVQHLHAWRGSPAARVLERAERILKAYEDVGMRVSYAYMLRDQNRLVYGPDEQFVASLPTSLASEVGGYVDAQAIPLADHLLIFRTLWERHRSRERTRIQLAPGNLHWCSDDALAAVAESARKHDVGMHMHLLETAYQKEYARRRTGGSAVEYLSRFGLLGPHLTIGHGTWLTAADIARLGETGTAVCSNPSSNLRLRSGVAPVNQLLAAGVQVALGLDEAGINDDRDMFQEMRLALRLHRVPGMGDGVPTPSEIFRMATEWGAGTTGFGGRIGTLEPGKAADLVLVPWRHIEYPHLDPDTTVVDAIVYRARATGVDTVLIAGEPVVREGKITRVDKAAALAELAASLRVPLRPHEEQRRRMSRQLLPEVRHFYDGWLDESAWEPFYRQNSKR